jgi:Trk K+ transport system NAD-binding subunit
MEVEVPAGLNGKVFSDLNVPGEINVSTIVRAGSAILPSDGFKFEAGDTVFVNVLRESAGKLERLLGLKE